MIWRSKTSRMGKPFTGWECSQKNQGVQSGAQLFLVDVKQIHAVPQTRPLPKDPFASEYIAGSQGHVAFVSREASGQPKPDLFWSDGKSTEVCASAHNDPFDPRRRFRGFGRLEALNARGQLLFEASTQQDAESLIHNERLCLYTPAAKAKSVEAEVPPGEVREIARQGEMLPGTDWTVASDRDCWSSAFLNDHGDVVFAQMESTGMEMVAGCIAVLPAGGSKWRIVLRAQQPLGEPPLNIQAVSFPSVNAQCQIACAVQVVDRKTQQSKQQLLRIQSDGKLTVLARSGDQLAAGVIVEGISAPHILSDGKVVYQAALRAPDFSTPREEALVIADGTQQRLILRQADLSATGFQLPKMEQFQASDTGHVGVKVKGDAFEDALLLATPDFSSPQGK